MGFHEKLIFTNFNFLLLKLRYYLSKFIEKVKNNQIK